MEKPIRAIIGKNIQTAGQRKKPNVILVVLSYLDNDLTFFFFFNVILTYFDIFVYECSSFISMVAFPASFRSLNTWFSSIFIYKY